MVKIVVGVLKHNDKYLLAKRRKGSHQEYKWEFPGGKLEMSEKEDEALKREFKEELDINIDVKELICEVTHNYPRMRIRAKSYYVETKENNKLKKLVHEEIKWVKKDELLKVDMVEADKKIVKKILETNINKGSV